MLLFGCSPSQSSHASKTESSLASTSPALDGSPSLLHSTLQSFSSLFMLYTSTQRSLSSQLSLVAIFVELAISSPSLLHSRTRGSRPYYGTVQVASLVRRDHHSVQQPLLFTVVTVVVTGTLCFFTVSLTPLPNSLPPQSPLNTPSPPETHPETPKKKHLWTFSRPFF